MPPGCLAATFAIAVLVGSPVAQGGAPALSTLLQRAGAYAEAYVTRLSSVVAEERYRQRVTGQQTGGSVQLRSDFLLVQAPGTRGWVPFRDVIEVNGRRVQDRENRLLHLFLERPAEAAARAREITEESARFNIGVTRTINVPLLALLFLLPEHVGGFEFGEEGAQRIDGAGVRVLTYREVGRPTMIRGFGGADLPAEGRLWLEPETGRVLRTQLVVKSGRIATDITVTYGEDPALGMLAPVRMSERYDYRGTTLTGTATYSNFRRFTVDVKTDIGPPR
jgi:hypothetical protein